MEEKEKKSALTSGLMGSVVGAVNGLFGGGGGMIAVPALQGLGLSEKEAHATAILIILPVSAFSFLLYALRGYLDFQVLIPTAIGVFFGGLVGAQLLQKLPVKAVNLAFAALQLFAGFWLIFGK